MMICPLAGPYTSSSVLFVCACHPTCVLICVCLRLCLVVSHSLKGADKESTLQKLTPAQRDTVLLNRAVLFARMRKWSDYEAVVASLKASNACDLAIALAEVAAQVERSQWREAVDRVVRVLETTDTDVSATSPRAALVEALQRLHVQLLIQMDNAVDAARVLAPQLESATDVTPFLVALQLHMDAGQKDQAGALLADVAARCAKGNRRSVLLLEQLMAALLRQPALTTMLDMAKIQKALSEAAAANVDPVRQTALRAYAALLQPSAEHTLPAVQHGLSADDIDALLIQGGGKEAVVSEPSSEPAKGKAGGGAQGRDKEATEAAEAEAAAKAEEKRQQEAIIAAKKDARKRYRRRRRERYLAALKASGTSYGITRL